MPVNWWKHADFKPTTKLLPVNFHSQVNAFPQNNLRLFLNRFTLKFSFNIDARNDFYVCCMIIWTLDESLGDFSDISTSWPKIIKLQRAQKSKIHNEPLKFRTYFWAHCIPSLEPFYAFYLVARPLPPSTHTARIIKTLPDPPNPLPKTPHTHTTTHDLKFASSIVLMHQEPFSYHIYTKQIIKSINSLKNTLKDTIKFIQTCQKLHDSYTP